jgi:hypothetical protein
MELDLSDDSISYAVDFREAFPEVSIFLYVHLCYARLSVHQQFGHGQTVPRLGKQRETNGATLLPRNDSTNCQKLFYFGTVFDLPHVMYANFRDHFQVFIVDPSTRESRNLLKIAYSFFNHEIPIRF